MIHVQFPQPEFRIQKQGDAHLIFDVIRKRWVVLTEEEWVRQNFVQYLLKELHYPAAVLALEKEILLHELKKRFDILVYDAGHRPWMLVECKAPQIPLSQPVLDQVLRYNISVPVEFIIITNGRETMGWQKTGTTLQAIHELPGWAVASSS